MSPPAATTPRLAARGLSWQAPDGRAVLDGLDLDLPWPGRVGLVGRNGAGKSTLLRLLAGELQPTAGAVQREARLAWLPQRAGCAPEATVAQALGVGSRLEALRRLEAGEYSEALQEAVGEDWELEGRVGRLLEGLGLGHLRLDRIFGTLSGGEQARTLLAARLVDAPDFLLLDEPTNHLDARSRAALTEVVDGWRGGLLLASHDRALLEHVDAIWELSPEGLRVTGGPWSVHAALRAAEAEAAAAQLAHAEAELRRARRTRQELAERQARRSARGVRSRREGSQPRLVLNAKREQAQGTSARVAARGEALESRARAAREAAEARVQEDGGVRLDLAGTRLPAGKVVLRATGLVLRAGEFTLGPLDLTVRGPERLALIGDNGTGKSTLLRGLRGELQPAGGSLERAPLRWATLDQHAGFLDPGRSVLDNLQQLRPELAVSEARWWLDRCGFSRFEVDKPVGGLSGGERVKAALACLLAGAEPPQVLVLDEPGNDLDLASLETLAAALRAFEGALLVVSHDAVLLDELGVGRRVRLVREGDRARIGAAEEEAPAGWEAP